MHDVENCSWAYVVLDLVHGEGDWHFEEEVEDGERMEEGGLREGQQVPSVSEVKIIVYNL